MSRIRLEWLERALGLTPGERYGGGAYTDGRPFVGIYLAEELHTSGNLVTHGWTTNQGPNEIELNGSVLKNPLEQFIIALHERGHLLNGDWKVNDDLTEENARGHAVDSLAPAFGRDLAADVYGSVVNGRFEERNDLPELVQKLWECQDQRLQPRYRLVVKAFEEWGKSLPQPSPILPVVEGKRKTIMIHERAGGRIVSPMRLIEVYASVESGEILGVVGSGSVEV